MHKTPEIKCSSRNPAVVAHNKFSLRFNVFDELYHFADVFIEIHLYRLRCNLRLKRGVKHFLTKLIGFSFNSSALQSLNVHKTFVLCQHHEQSTNNDTNEFEDHTNRAMYFVLDLIAFEIPKL